MWSDTAALNAVWSNDEVSGYNYVTDSSWTIACREKEMYADVVFFFCFFLFTYFQVYCCICSWLHVVRQGGELIIPLINHIFTWKNTSCLPACLFHLCPEWLRTWLSLRFCYTSVFTVFDWTVWFFQIYFPHVMQLIEQYALFCLRVTHWSTVGNY